MRTLGCIRREQSYLMTDIFTGKSSAEAKRCYSMGVFGNSAFWGKKSCLTRF